MQVHAMTQVSWTVQMDLNVNFGVFYAIEDQKLKEELKEEICTNTLLGVGCIFFGNE